LLPPREFIFDLAIVHFDLKWGNRVKLPTSMREVTIRSELDWISQTEERTKYEAKSLYRVSFF